MVQSKSRSTSGLRESIGTVGLLRSYRHIPRVIELIKYFADLHKMKAPYQPSLATDDDTRHFDEDIPNEVSLPFFKLET